MGSGSLNHMLQQMLDRWKLLAVSHHRIILHKKLLGSPMSWLAASCPELLLGASTVRSEGLVGATAGGGAACLAALGFLATPVCRLASCPPGQRLLGKGEEVGAFTVGREGGGRGWATATTPVTTASLVCLPGSS